MMESPCTSNMFLITYDCGKFQESVAVPHSLFNEDADFRKNIVCMKCLNCNFESKFVEDEK